MYIHEYITICYIILYRTDHLNDDQTMESFLFLSLSILSFSFVRVVFCWSKRTCSRLGTVTGCNSHQTRGPMWKWARHTNPLDRTSNIFLRHMIALPPPTSDHFTWTQRLQVWTENNHNQYIFHVHGLWFFFLSSC